MEQYELLSLTFTVGVSIPILLYAVYWLALDQAKRYTDSEIREVKR